MRSLAIVLVAGGLLVAGIPAQGQNKTVGTDASKYKDGVARVNGKMMQIVNGRMMPMNKHVTLQDGTLVNTDGTIHSPKGETKKLPEGMAINQTGRIVIFKDDMFTTDVIDSSSEEAGYQQHTVIITTPEGETIIKKE